MLQRRGKAAADHIPQNVKNHHIRFIQKMVLLQQLHGLTHDITATAGAGRRAARFHAFHTIKAFKHEIFRTQFLRMKIDFFENIDHRRDQGSGQCEGAVMLWITADLQHALAQLGKRRRQV